MLLSGEVIQSSSSFLNSNNNFNIYRMKLYGAISAYKSARIIYEIEGFHTKGELPYQMMYSLPGNIESAGKSFTFRTLRPTEIFGDNGIIFNMENNFNDELFRLFKIPYLKDWQLMLTGYFNAAWLTISEKSEGIIPVSFTEFKKPFYEIGFGIGHMLFPFSLEFTWKLNHKGKNDFVIGINSIAL